MPTPTGSSRADPVAREAQVIALLDELPRELGSILIGGYAVAAFGPPRYSVDVDLVLPEASRPNAAIWFTSVGASFRQSLKFEHAGSEWTKARISRDLVEGDAYFGGLRARESGAVVDYPWIAKHPVVKRLTLSTGITHRETRVARAEAIWVLKLLAGRAQDITDLFVISQWRVDESEVRSQLTSLLNQDVRSHLRRVATRLSSDKEYRDALSRAILGSPSDPANVKLWASFKRTALNCLPDL